MGQEQPLRYLKTADAAGKPTMQIFDLVERKQQTQTAAQSAEADFVKRSKFDELRKIVDALTAKKVESEAVENG